MVGILSVDVEVTKNHDREEKRRIKVGQIVLNKKDIATRRLVNVNEKML